MHQRALKERENLSMFHLITSADELHDALSEIGSEMITAKKKMDKKRTLTGANQYSEGVKSSS